MTPEEAIKILRLNKDRMNGSVQMALATLHPELTESEEDKDNMDKVINLLYILVSYVDDDCTITQEKTEELRDCIQKVICPWLKSLRPQSRQEVSYQTLTAREKELLEGKQVEGPKNCRNCRKEKHCFREDTHWGGPCEDYEREEGKQ